MAYLNDLLRRLEALPVEQIAETALDNTEEDLAEIQRQQMLDGVGPSGPGELGTYKSQEYADEKHRQNHGRPGYGNKDLYRTGDFSRKIVVNIVGDEVIIESKGRNAEDIVAQAQKDGTEVYGLNVEYKKEYIKKYLRPAFHKKLVEQIKMKLSA